MQRVGSLDQSNRQALSLQQRVASLGIAINGGYAGITESNSMDNNVLALNSFFIPSEISDVLGGVISFEQVFQAIETIRSSVENSSSANFHLDRIYDDFVSVYNLMNIVVYRDQNGNLNGTGPLIYSSGTTSTSLRTLIDRKSRNLALQVTLLQGSINMEKDVETKSAVHNLIAALTSALTASGILLAPKVRQNKERGSRRDRKKKKGNKQNGGDLKANAFVSFGEKGGDVRSTAGEPVPYEELLRAVGVLTEGNNAREA